MFICFFLSDEEVDRQYRKLSTLPIQFFDTLSLCGILRKYTVVIHRPQLAGNGPRASSVRWLPPVESGANCGPPLCSLCVPAVWGFSVLSVTLVSLFALTGVFVVPCVKTRFGRLVLIYFIGLSVGTLFSTAVFQLLPEVQ